jgi:hypothetical protein
MQPLSFPVPTVNFPSVSEHGCAVGAAVGVGEATGAAVGVALGYTDGVRPVGVTLGGTDGTGSEGAADGAFGQSSYGLIIAGYRLSQPSIRTTVLPRSSEYVTALSHANGKS